jgi:hypothetical protein
MRRRRSPIRSPPPLRRRSPLGGYRRSSRSPPYRRRSPGYSPRGPSPSRRRSPIRSGIHTRTPSPPRHRLPSPSRSALRRPLVSPPRSGQGSRRVSPLGHRRSPIPMRKRTRSPEKGEAQAKEEDDHLSKKRRTLDGQEMRDADMQDVKREPEEPVNPPQLERRTGVLPPTEPRSVRELREANKAKEAATSPALKIKTEVQDVEMVDVSAGVDSPKTAGLSAPTAPRSMLSKQVALSKQVTTAGAANPSSTTPTSGNPPPTTPSVTIPTMRAWKKDTMTPDLDAEVSGPSSSNLESRSDVW